MKLFVLNQDIPYRNAFYFSAKKIFQVIKSYRLKLHSSSLTFWTELSYYRLVTVVFFWLPIGYVGDKSSLLTSQGFDSLVI